jgi:hypothetical protein
VINDIHRWQSFLNPDVLSLPVALVNQRRVNQLEARLRFVHFSMPWFVRWIPGTHAVAKDKLPPSADASSKL